MLPVALHSIRTLVCTATNATPHERFLQFRRRTASGHALPTWLVNKGTVLVKKHARSSKYESLVEEADIMDLTPTYAKVKFQNGRESTVSLRDLAPLPQIKNADSTEPLPTSIPCEPPSSTTTPLPPVIPNPNDKIVSGETTEMPTKELPVVSEVVLPRRSTRPRTQTEFYQSG